MQRMNAQDPPKTRSERIYSLDGLRGVACLVVLLLHIGIMIQPFGPSDGYAFIPGTAAVMVFYVLSGVVLSLVPLKRLHPIRKDPHLQEEASKPEEGGYDWFAYYPRRVVRLCFPLFAAILLGVVAGFVAQGLGSTSRSAIAVDYSGSLQSIIHDILMQFDVLFNVSDDGFTLYGDPLVRVDSPVWSMSWELWFSLTLPLCIFFALLFKRDGIAIASLLFCVFAAHFTGYFPLRFGIMFILGVIIAKHYRSCAARRLSPLLEGGLLIGCLLLIELSYTFARGTFLYAVGQTAMNGACVGLVFLALTNGFVRRMLSTKPCQWLGKISYSMYLTHAITIGGLQALLPRFGMTGSLQAACALILSFIVAWVFWYCVERPSITWSHRVGKIAASAENPHEQ